MQKRALSVCLVPGLNRELEKMLCQHRTKLESCTSLESAKDSISKRQYCLIAADVVAVAPKIAITGLERMRRLTYAPVLLITQPGNEEELIAAGADCCVAADALRMVIPAAYALLRRYTLYNHYDELRSPDSVIYRGGLVLDHLRHQVTLDGEVIHFTPKEYKLLLHFARNPGVVISVDQICEEVWGVGFDENRDVTTVIAELRRKLKDTRENPIYIKTVYGFGYTFLPYE